MWPLALAAVFAGIEFFVARHQRRRLVLPACALIFSFVLAIILIARSAPQVAAFADGALFEVHTRNALQGQQALGAYSQFGWSHPGPLAFYVFGPLYQLGGAGQFSLNSAAFTINVLALLLTVALAIRYGDGALPVQTRDGLESGPLLRRDHGRKRDQVTGRGPHAQSLNVLRT